MTITDCIQTIQLLSFSILVFIIVIESSSSIKDEFLKESGNHEVGEATSMFPSRLIKRAVDTPPTVNQTSAAAPAQALEIGKISDLLIKSLSSFTTHYDAREISHYLESHPAYAVHEPRVYFTEERTSRSLSIMLHELQTIPPKLRFAYLVRVFNELGRKIATKLNYYTSEVVAILRKKPDDLGNKPDVNILVDAINNAFESKEDRDIKESDGDYLADDALTKLLEDKEKSSIFNSSLVEIAQRLAHMMTHFTLETNKTSLQIADKNRELMSTVLGESLQIGTWTMVKELSNSDKYRISDEVIIYTDKIIQTALTIYNRHIKTRDTNVGEAIKKQFNLPNLKSFSDLSPISDKNGLIGPWNSYLFSNLGSSERVIKLFGSLMSRVPVASKSRWFNMYVSQVHLELERTLSGFVYMQATPFHTNSSDAVILDSFNKTSTAAKQLNIPKTDYQADKNRIPARCYLAGRRWRLILTRALRGYLKQDEVLKSISNKITQLKLKLANQSGNEMYRMCLPRLEVGLKGYSINGEPIVDGGATNKFALKDPIEGLRMLKDPFFSGVDLGYKFGFKLGFNEERNATLEMEMSGKEGDTKSEEKKSDGKEIAKASYRRAVIESAKRSFEISIHEGYLNALKVTMRAGLQIVIETASKMSSLKCATQGGVIGKEAGRAETEKYLQDKAANETERRRMIEIGERNGEVAGKVTGDLIGSIIGAKAAEEAYKRNVIRGGKLARAKFHLEEYEAGACLAFKHGLKEGKRVGSSSSLDPSAPKFLRFPKSAFLASDEESSEEGVDHWDKELIPPLTDKILSTFQQERGYTLVSGTLKGSYKITKETKKGFQRVSFSNITYDLEVHAQGFIMNDIAYLNLNGTVNKGGPLYGSLIAKDIFNDFDE